MTLFGELLADPRAVDLARRAAEEDASYPEAHPHATGTPTAPDEGIAVGDLMRITGMTRPTMSWPLGRPAHITRCQRIRAEGISVFAQRETEKENLARGESSILTMPSVRAVS